MLLALRSVRLSASALRSPRAPHAAHCTPRLASAVYPLASAPAGCAASPRRLFDAWRRPARRSPASRSPTSRSPRPSAGGYARMALRASRAWRATAEADTYAPGPPLVVQATRASLPRWVHAGGAGRLAPWAPRTIRTGYAYQPRPYCTCRSPWHPRRLPPAARRRERRLPAHARAHGRARRPSSAGQPAGRPRLQLLGRPALCTRRLAATRAGRLSAAAPSGHPWRNHGPCSMLRVPVARDLYISNSCVCHCCRFLLTVPPVLVEKSSVDISPLVQNPARTAYCIHPRAA